MQNFEYNANPARVLFGSGTIQRLPDEVKRLNLSAPLILCTPRQTSLARTLETILDGKIAGIFARAVMHTPVHITEEALTYAKECSADGVVSIGGGSTIGLGKAIAIRTELPHICIPTTYSGSEMTPVLGETAEGRKTTRSDSRILPATVVYDVDLTMTLPPAISAVSGVNAIAHSVEALYAKNTNPVINMLALEGIRSLAKALPEIVEDPTSTSARWSAFYGAWLCGMCLGSVGMALHHKLCHVLGGSFGLPHAESHTVVLPHALAYNAPCIPEVMEKMAGVLPGSDGDAIKGLNVLLNTLKVKRSLRELGMKEQDIDKAVEIATSNAYWNPRKIEKEALRETIQRCWAGEEAR